MEKKQRTSGKAKKGKKLPGILLVCVAYVISGAGIWLTITKQFSNNQSIKPKVPVMEIILNDVSMAEIQSGSKEERYEGNTVVLNGKEYGNVEIKGRGNSSWMADKKSFRLKFASKVDLLTLGKARKWALIGNFLDDSLMRNDLANYLARLVFDGYSLSGDFVKLVVDGENYGLYYLTETVEIDKRKIDLRNDDGVIVEFDNAHCKGEEYWSETKTGNCLVLKDVVRDDIAEEVLTDFVRDYETLELVAKEGNYKKVKEIADATSLAEYFIISELTSNPDAYLTSWYWYRDGVEDEMKTKIAWDFDAAFGNNNWGEWPEEFYSPGTRMARMNMTMKKDEQRGACGGSLVVGQYIEGEVQSSMLFCDLLAIPEFREEVSEVYRLRVKGHEQEILQYLIERKEYIMEVALEDHFVMGDFITEVNYLYWWMKNRLDYFSETFMEHQMVMEYNVG